MMETQSAERVITGHIEIRRVGRRGFPVAELLSDGVTIASLGRDSSFNIFFGPGRLVVLADGTEWRIKAANSNRHIVPIIKSEVGTVAFSGPLYGKRSYGITGRDYGYSLMPLGRIGLRSPGIWTLRQHETDIASVDDRQMQIEALQPVPTAAVLLVFTLVNHGVPGEADLMPRVGW
ncbi:MAG: hypothetical protein GY720_05770 [bacterium]|nr:hypothetical protein [bacterium]